MRLVVTEKPSVGRDIARVLGARGKHDGWIEGPKVWITWCIGHLVELEEPAHYNDAWRRWSLGNLPMIPERFALRARKNARKQWKVVKRLLRDRTVSEVINACDAGREGELIFRYIYDLAGCDKPVRRLWVSSLTDEAIQKAWAGLRAGAEYDALAAAARCRSEADWLVGLNATRAMTCLARRAGGDQLLSVGRVQTPTLAMVVERDRAIEAFIPQPFWRVEARFAAEVDGEAARWTGRWFQRGRDPRDDLPAGAPRAHLEDAAREDRFFCQDKAQALAKVIEGKRGVVTQASRRRIKEPPPLLYDLTTLQQRANQRFGLSAQQTLEVAQKLYEKHKLLTYPRTDARYLTPDQLTVLPGVVETLGQIKGYAPFAEAILARPIKPGKRVIDASEVGDHHAILPTDRAPRQGQLDRDEQRIYDMVARRLLAALSTDAVFDLTRLTVTIGDRTSPAPLPEGVKAPLRFRSKGRVCRDEGWRAVDPPGQSKEVELPAVDKGDAATVDQSRVHDGKTRPPRAHNDGSVLRTMETAGKELEDAELKRALRSGGLGTPATRASVLQTLLDRGFLARKGRELHATDAGRALIDAIPIDELKSAELTGRWEARLSAIADGQESRDAFMRDVAEHTARLIQAMRRAELPEAVTQLTRGERKKGGKGKRDGARPAPRFEGPSLGDCPLCKTPVRASSGAFTCESGRQCAFVVYKDIARREISADEVRHLLAHGRTAFLDGFMSKKERPFTAALFIEDSGKVSLAFPPHDHEARRAPSPVGMTCPSCGDGQIVRGRAAWGCGRWREGCPWRLSFERDGQRLSEAEAAALIRQAQPSAGAA